MSARPDTWMPMFWGDYARDTGHLNAAAHGAYLMLIKHYWCSGGPLADDNDELWRVACCDSKREWLKLRPKLERLFRIEDGKLHHKRIDEELATAARRTAAKAEAGRKGAEKRWQTDGAAMAKPSPSQRRTDAQSQSQGKEEPNGSSKNRGTRLPDGFEPDHAEAKEQGLDDLTARREAAKFCDYWRGVSGQRGVKRDWPATWRNWCRKVAEERGLSPPTDSAGPAVETKWVSDDSPLWPELAERHRQERGKYPPKTDGDGGMGWRFPTAWFLKRTA